MQPWFTVYFSSERWFFLATTLLLIPVKPDSSVDSNGHARDSDLPRDKIKLLVVQRFISNSLREHLHS